MKKFSLKSAASFLLLSAMTMLALPAAQADDTDLFDPTAAQAAATIPNVIFVFHNPTNWNNQSQHFPSGLSVGAQEAASIRDLIASISRPVNVGLVMHAGNGGFVRSALREVGATTTQNLANRTAMRNMFSSMASNIGSETSVTPNAAYTADALYETLLYLQSARSISQDSSKDYPNNTGFANSAYNNGMTTGPAYASSATGSAFTPPVIQSCAKTYIIFMAADQNQYFAQPPLGAPSRSLVPSAGAGMNGMEVAWANYLKKQKNITMFTFDSWYSKQDSAMSTGLQQMAQYGGGKYFSTRSQAEITAALKTIFNNIQSVNSVFASSSLPVSVNVRGTYLNQVYMGVFRPDSSGKPNWTGNLKQYKLAVNNTTTPPSLYLVDSLGNAVDNQSSGFTTPSAVSYWTKASTFWSSQMYPDSQGLGGTSDSADGDLVEKGGVGQGLRTTYASNQGGRNVYTCTGACTAGSALSSYLFNTSNANITTTALGASSTTDSASIINWVRGGNTTLDDSPNTPQVATDVRGMVHGDVLHSRPAIINYGGADNIVAYYGANDGMIHAVKGGQDTSVSGFHPVADGTELWSVVLPEHFSSLKILRDHSPLITPSTPHVKPFFADGAFATYAPPTSDGVIDYTRGDKAYLYITMRRGGNFIYALDVSNPAAPKLLWKKSQSDTGFGELGQSWSEPVVINVKGMTNPLIAMGLGYDSAADDAMPQGVATKGRGVILIDATTGAPVWQAGALPLGATTNLPVVGMDYSIPASVTALDTDGDGYIDRLYAVDTGANVWRINLDNGTTSNSPSTWTVTKLASLGGTGANARKFLYQPDVVLADSTHPFDSILLGSGDREQPFDTTIQNDFFMLKDSHAKNTARTLITMATLFDGTNTAAPASTTDGFFITLSVGEKVVGNPATLNGTVFFGTNLPTAVATNVCTPNLGEARLYSIDYLSGSATIDNTANGTLTAADRYAVRAGGGYPPAPVLVSVKINGQIYQGAISGSQVLTAPGVSVNSRKKTYWYKPWK
ncbi:MAG: type IV pilus assembly protein PilY1 [Porticoccaceae bacterium]|jgi:type IV pilus assembly protein PilY1